MAKDNYIIEVKIIMIPTKYSLFKLLIDKFRYIQVLTELKEKINEVRKQHASIKGTVQLNYVTIEDSNKFVRTFQFTVRDEKYAEEVIKALEQIFNYSDNFKKIGRCAFVKLRIVTDYKTIWRGDIYTLEIDHIAGIKKNNLSKYEKNN